MMAIFTIIGVTLTVIFGIIGFSVVVGGFIKYLKGA